MFTVVFKISNSNTANGCDPKYMENAQIEMPN